MLKLDGNLFRLTRGNGVFVLLCYSIKKEFVSVCLCAACVERERGLPSLPTVGPGLHLLLWEEDSAGGAREGLHVL